MESLPGGFSAGGGPSKTKTLGVVGRVGIAQTETTVIQDGAPKIAKLVYKWLNYGLW